jgi:hypothetical protein
MHAFLVALEGWWCKRHACTHFPNEIYFHLQTREELESFPIWKGLGTLPVVFDSLFQKK